MHLVDGIIRISDLVEVNGPLCVGWVGPRFATEESKRAGPSYASSACEHLSPARCGEFFRNPLVDFLFN